MLMIVYYNGIIKAGNSERPSLSNQEGQLIYLKASEGGGDVQG